MKNRIFTISVLITLLMHSCADDPCKDINCLNGGLCIEGSCDCPEGFVGAFCEQKDVCLGVTCPYDGECMEGSCICVDLTKNYIDGAWLFEGTNYVLRFNVDGSFWDAGGKEYTYELNMSARTITTYDLDGSHVFTYNILEDNFFCDKLNLGTAEGEKTNTLIRQ
ncbi:MAG: hypothetical protein AAGA77_20635 [Bacteroidota bacterium]